jgi:hypothetical protein
MKSIGGSVLVGAPYSAMRYRHARHICADCLSAAPDTLEFAPLSLGPTPLLIHSACSVCEQRRCIAVVQVTAKGAS